MNYSPRDTIVAIATPVGVGAVGMLRLSGEEAFSVASRVLRRIDGRHYELEGLPSHTVHYGLLTTQEGGKIDEVLFVLFKGPRSYTREDVVEITCHGGPVVLQRGLKALIEAGARMARPGEFTLRAFLNGRLDLVQAEAVLDLIEAKTEEGAIVALNQLEGGLSCRIGMMRDALKSVLACIDVSIDFPDEVEMQRERIMGEAQKVLSDIEALLATFREGRVYREGVSVALVGLPNVGKSSLLNAFLGKDRAIVTPVPGTTRDVIEEEVSFGGVVFRFMDTAGMGKAKDIVEKEGVERTQRCLEGADMVLVVLDVSRPLMAGDFDLIKAAASKGVVILNKIDLPRAWPREEIEGVALPIFEVSAKRGDGLETLKRGIAEIALEGHTGGNEPLLTNVRHYQALMRAKEALKRFMEGSEEGLSEECLAEDLRAALNALGELTGEAASEEILDTIFSRFCIGK